MNMYTLAIRVKYNMNTMQDKRPYNEQGQAHGYWEATWHDGGWYKGHFVNHMAKG